jgi:hypothetical protein
VRSHHGSAWPGSVGNVAFDGRTDLGGCDIGEWVELVVLDLHDTHNVISPDGDLVRSAVFDDDLAVLVFVNADY